MQVNNNYYETGFLSSLKHYVGLQVDLLKVFRYSLMNASN